MVIPDGPGSAPIKVKQFSADFYFIRGTGLFPRVVRKFDDGLVPVLAVRLRSDHFYDDIQRFGAHIIGKIGAYPVHIVYPSICMLFYFSNAVRVQGITEHDGLGYRINTVILIMLQRLIDEYDGISAVVAYAVLKLCMQPGEALKEIIRCEGITQCNTQFSLVNAYPGIQCPGIG